MQVVENNGSRSYKDMVIGQSGNKDEEDEYQEDDVDKEDVEEGEGMKEEECRIGQYDCSTFVFYIFEERQIHHPLRKSVIVKLLGRKIGPKALETRLKQMWV